MTLHGSWNRTVPTGAKVVRVRLDSSGHRATGVEDFIGGWQLPDGSRWGRPVSLLVLPDGSLLVSDDQGGKIWRVSYGRECEAVERWTVGTLDGGDARLGSDSGP